MIQAPTHRTIRIGAVFAASTFATMNFAQEVPLEPGGLQMRFGVAERLEYGRNLALDVPEEGNGFIASTILSFGLSSETRTQTLDLDVVTGLRLQDLPDNTDNFDVGDTRLDFGYTREAANSGLAVDAEYLRFDIGFLRSLSDFEDEDGFITLPADFSSLTGDGTRSDYFLGFAFDGGRESLIGYNLGLFSAGVNYSDTEEFDDIDTISGELGFTFALTPVTTTSLTYFKENFEEDDDDQTDRDTDIISVGVSHESSDRTRIDATIGYADITERREILGDRDEAGVVGNLGVFHDVSNGTVFGEYDSSLNASGRLDRLVVGRTLPIPDGDFAISLGAAHRPDGSVDPIGALLFDRDFGPNFLRVRLSRDIIADTDDEYTLSNVVDLGYLWRLTPVSQFGLRATYAITEATVTEPRSELGFFSAVYSHELTSDWRFNAGFDYRISEDDAGRATSPLVFASIGKEFFWRR